MHRATRARKAWTTYCLDRLNEFADADWRGSAMKHPGYCSHGLIVVCSVGVANSKCTVRPKSVSIVMEYLKDFESSEVRHVKEIDSLNHIPCTLQPQALNPCREQGAWATESFRNSAYNTPAGPPADSAPLKFTNLISRSTERTSNYRTRTPQHHADVRSQILPSFILPRRNL